MRPAIRSCLTFAVAAAEFRLVITAVAQLAQTEREINSTAHDNHDRFNVCRCIELHLF